MQRQLKALICKRLDQIVDYPQPHHCLNSFCIVCGSNHNNIRIHSFHPEDMQQLGSVHLRHENIQHNQINRMILQINQRRVG